ncbi:IS66 family insertion sequence element accessory protein TnpB [Enterobacteriaceae bacterium ESL0689]|nr:IS66 family insertion sequence element accessory protein TnpB [Enterobacteriaceae bacterium ESL0689]
MKRKWCIEQKKQHVADWRASGLTRRQYCVLNDISFASFRDWPRDVARAEQPARAPAVLPVHLSGSSSPVAGTVTFFLHGGIQLRCLPSQFKHRFR